MAASECGKVIKSLFRRSSNSEYLEKVNNRAEGAKDLIQQPANLFLITIGPPWKRYQHPVYLIKDQDQSKNKN